MLCTTLGRDITELSGYLVVDVEGLLQSPSLELDPVDLLKDLEAPEVKPVDPEAEHGGGALKTLLKDGIGKGLANVFLLLGNTGDDTLSDE